MALRSCEFDGRRVYLTWGMNVRGRQLVGVFESPEDAAGLDADQRAVAVVTADKLSAAQQQLARDNTDALSD